MTPPAVAEAPQATRIADRYELGEMLGQGGMGEVRAAVDLRLGREVAVKVLRPTMAHRPDARRRFTEEARAAARLSQFNVVQVYDSGTHDGVPYLVMERLPGRTLADELAEGPVGVARACRVASDILKALDAAHKAGIVHRDIKPANVLLCPDGTAKVTDFGVAKTIECGDATVTGLLFGTPAYLAPERVAGEPATPQTDIYSVGVVLYQALSGHKPFEADSPVAVALAIHEASPVSLAARIPGLPAWVTAVVEQAMDPDPKRRFRSAADMDRALQAPAANSTTRLWVQRQHVKRPYSDNPRPVSSERRMQWG